MYKVGQYVIYRKDLCKVVGIKEKHFKDMDYYILNSMDDTSLTLEVPVDNRSGFLRDLITKKDVENILEEIPNIEVIQSNDKFLENEYKQIMSSGNHEDLIKVIKTTHSRNKARLEANKKVSDKDNFYFNQAEKYLYNEFSVVLGLSFEDTKQYVIDNVTEMYS